MTMDMYWGRIPRNGCRQLWDNWISLTGNKAFVHPKTIVNGVSDGVLGLFTEQDVEHRMWCPKNRTGTWCEPYVKKLPSVSHNPLVGRNLETIKKSNAEKKVGRETQLTAFEVLVYPCTISQLTPGSWANCLLSRTHKNYQFSKARLKANASDMF